MYDTLVISGGGVKGFAILGGIQALFDAKMLDQVKNYYGTSVGSLLCYLLAIGYTPLEIIKSLYENKWLERVQSFNLVAMLNGNGATNFTPINEALEKLTINKVGQFLTLGKLRELYGKTLVCTTYNMTICRSEYLGPDNYPDLPCITALRMSSNIPLIFDRFRYMDNFYVDGGLADNFPIMKALEHSDRVVGLYLDIDARSLRDEPDDGLVAYFLRILQVPVIQSTTYRANLANNRCTVIPIRAKDLRGIIEFDVKSRMRLDMFSEGYSSVNDYLQTIESNKEKHN